MFWEHWKFSTELLIPLFADYVSPFFFRQSHANLSFHTVRHCMTRTLCCEAVTRECAGQAHTYGVSTPVRSPDRPVARTTERYIWAVYLYIYIYSVLYFISYSLIRCSGPSSFETGVVILGA